MNKLSNSFIKIGTKTTLVTDIGYEKYSQRNDWIAQETPVSLIYNSEPYAVVMCTPLDLEDFAYGFSLTERIIEHHDQITNVVVNDKRKDGYEIFIDIQSDKYLKLKKRNTITSSSCGTCGLTSLNELKNKLKTVNTVSAPVSKILDAASEIKNSQQIQKLTGATHASAWFDLSTDAFVLREDIGRHNALDKLIGYIIQNQIKIRNGFAFTTSRASFEMIQKSITLGFGMLISVSAPTQMAIDLAIRYNVALGGFIKKDKIVAYTFPDRFVNKKGI